MDTWCRDCGITLFLVLFGVASCGGAELAAGSGVPKTPTTGEAFAGEGQVSCSAVRAQSEPDLMGWDSASRMSLNTLRTAGVVAVRYRAQGCNVELEILQNCIGKGEYRYQPYASSDTKVAKSAQDLYAQLPVGAARLVGRLQGNRALRTDYVLVGMAALPPGGTYAASNLKGPDCQRATHVVSRVYLGGFAMEAGVASELESGASVFGVGAGAKRSGSEQRVFFEGNPVQCAKAQESGELQPLCSVPLRIGLLAVGDATQSVVQAPTTDQAPTKTPGIARAPIAGRGPGMVHIPAGTFWMGSNNEKPNEAPVHKVTVSAFDLDVTEVTVAQYRACVSAGECSPPMVAQYCNFSQEGRDGHPINCVDWRQGRAFCTWSGKRLPTEAEWEYAARGADGRTYPWGNAAPGAQLCWNREKGGLGTCLVGSHPGGDSPFGVKDMAGNVWEWTSTEYCDSYAPEALCDRKNVVYRGGSWRDAVASDVRIAFRDVAARPAVQPNLGFRCAADTSE
jgi:formylglycine-generating enzyme